MNNNKCVTNLCPNKCETGTNYCELCQIGHMMMNFDQLLDDEIDNLVRVKK